MSNQGRQGFFASAVTKAQVKSAIFTAVSDVIALPDDLVKHCFHAV